MRSTPLKTACLTVFLFLFPLVSFSFQPPPEGPIHLSLEDVFLRVALREIAEQTAYRFVYHDDLVANRRVTCRLDEGSLDQVMDRILETTDLDYRVVAPHTVVLFRTVPEPAAPSIIDIQPETPPRLLYDIEPNYPWLARISGLEGSVVVNGLVSRSGRIEQTEIARSSGHAALDDAARAFVKRLEFEPARQGADAVDVWLSLDVDFELDARRISPDEYIDRITILRESLAAASGAERDSILRDILDVHTDFVATTARSGQNHNHAVASLILPGVKADWDALWEIRPLHFLVFHDFVQRHSDSPEASDAEFTLLYTVRRDVHRYLEAPVRPGPAEEGGVFLRLAHRMMETHYPQAISRELAEAVQNQPP